MKELHKNYEYIFREINTPVENATT